MQSVRTFAAASTPPSTLTWYQTALVMGIVAVALLLIGVIVIWARSKDVTGQSVVRSWIALALVAGLVLFCAVTFAINDPTLRSTVFGGLTTSVGAAIAFYFSSKTSDQARQDILSAMQHATGTPSAPGGGNKAGGTPSAPGGGNKADGTPKAADGSNASGADDSNDGGQS